MLLLLSSSEEPDPIQVKISAPVSRTNTSLPSNLSAVTSESLATSVNSSVPLASETLKSFLPSKGAA